MPNIILYFVNCQVYNKTIPALKNLHCIRHDQTWDNSSDKEGCGDSIGKGTSAGRKQKVIRRQMKGEVLLRKQWEAVPSFGRGEILGPRLQVFGIIWQLGERDLVIAQGTHSSGAPLPQTTGNRRCGRFAPLWLVEWHVISPRDLYRVKEQRRD